MKQRQKVKKKAIQIRMARKIDSNLLKYDNNKNNKS